MAIQAETVGINNEPIPTYYAGSAFLPAGILSADKAVVSREMHPDFPNRAETDLAGYAVMAFFLQAEDKLLKKGKDENRKALPIANAVFKALKVSNETYPNSPHASFARFNQITSGDEENPNIDISFINRLAETHPAEAANMLRIQLQGFVDTMRSLQRGSSALATRASDILALGLNLVKEEKLAESKEALLLLLGQLVTSSVSGKFSQQIAGEKAWQRYYDNVLSFFDK